MRKTKTVIVQCETCKLRQKIVQTLLEQDMYLSELATKMSMDRTTLAYHLGVMEKEGLLESGYRILDSKKAARFYHPTIKVQLET